MTDLNQAFANSELSLIHELHGLQARVDDTTGKGLATEELVDKRLLQPYVKPGMAAVRGEIVFKDPETAR